MTTDAFTFVLYSYDPSVIAAILFIIFFSSTTIGHIFLAWRFRARYFIAFIIGCIFELIGYIGRILSHSNPTALNPYIMQSLLLLVAPILYAATLYLILGRLIRALDAERLSPLPLRWFAKLFVGGDVFCFLIQGGGAGILATGQSSTMSLGNDIIIAGLILQVVLFSIFVAVAVTFHVRVAKLPSTNTTTTTTPWKKHMGALYFASLMILTRNLVRVVEYAQGNAGYITSHEVFLYVFDATLMFGVAAVYMWVHPGVVLDGRRRGLMFTVEAGGVEGKSLEG